MKAIDRVGLESSVVTAGPFYFDATPPGVVSGIANLDKTAIYQSEEHTLTEASDNCGVSHYQIAVSLTNDESSILTGWDYQTVTGSAYRVSSGYALSEGNPYFSLIRAVDLAGNAGAFVPSPSYQLPGPLAKVNEVSIISRAINSIQLGWTEPDNNGRVITDYLVEYKLSSATDWISFDDGVSDDIVLTITGLTENTSYDFRVTSWNGNYADSPSDVVTGSTLINDPFFDDVTYKLMNLGGATASAVVAFEDATEVKLGTTVIATLNAGETHEFASELNQILEADKPIFAAGRITGVDGNNTDGNVLWLNKDFSGKKFVFTLTRDAPHFLGLYSFEAGNEVTLTAPTASNNISVTLTEGEYATYDLPDVGGFVIESTGLLIAYTYSHGNASKVTDPKPIMPASTELIGFPSQSVKVTTESPTASINYLHGDDQSGTVSVDIGNTVSINPRVKENNSTSQYRAQPLILSSTEPIVANSNADSDGYCSAPFVPTVLMRKRFAINVSAQYVAFASLYDATITVSYPDGTSEDKPLTRTGTAGSPYSVYLENVPKGTLFVSDKRVQGWYEPDTYDFGSKDDETVLIGYD